MVILLIASRTLKRKGEFYYFSTYAFPVSGTVRFLGASWPTQIELTASNTGNAQLPCSSALAVSASMRHPRVNAIKN